MPIICQRVSLCFSVIVIYVKINNQVFLLSDSHLDPFISASVILQKLWGIYIHTVGGIKVEKVATAFPKIQNSVISFLVMIYGLGTLIFYVFGHLRTCKLLFKSLKPSIIPPEHFESRYDWWPLLGQGNKLSVFIFLKEDINFASYHLLFEANI